MNDPRYSGRLYIDNRYLVTLPNNIMTGVYHGITNKNSTRGGKSEGEQLKAKENRYTMTDFLNICPNV